MQQTPLIQLTSSFTNLDSAKLVAISCLEDKLCACVHISDPVMSMYIWKNKVQKEREYVVQFKTLKSLEKDLRKKISSLHPYECPEILSYAILAANSDYQEWIEDVCKNKKKSI